ncbi:MAG: 1,4-alpha-glucan branching protein domain-containing protein [bacterium]
MTKGYLSFVLHSHLPWVLGHGRWPHGTDWLSEAAAECYIPILKQLYRLLDEGFSPRLNIGITPILQEQLLSRHFHDEFDVYLKNKIKAAEQDINEFSRRGQKEFLGVATMWRDFYIDVQDDFINRFKKNLVNAFAQLQEQGCIEVITSAATHGYLPLLKNDRSVNAQINLGVQTYKQNFNKPPHGIWLPECAYRPAYKWSPVVGSDKTPYARRGVDEFVSRHNIDYFVVDNHLLKGGKAIGVYLSRFEALANLWEHFKKEFVETKEDFVKTPQEIYLVCSNPQFKPVAIFTRDPKTALQVWSGGVGYPGEPQYLDFHKKKFPSGLRYWRVTDQKVDLALKQNYNPGVVENITEQHAQHFLSLCKELAEEYYTKTGKPALICTPFDTELFGHWWFEGPVWLYHVLKAVEQDRDIELGTGSMLLKKFDPTKIISLPEGSWGEGGFHYIWLNKWTEWTWQRIYQAEDKFYELYDRYINTANTNEMAILKQLGRELLLLQSSDWQFLISTWSARDYAELRFSRHFDNFMHLANLLEKKDVAQDEMNFLKDLTEQDSCFADIDLSIFKKI